jgi:predicted GH43/DUF377 family glycosyl hydrolase
LPYFEVIADERLTIHAKEPLASYYQLSPFVWESNDGLHIMIRAVNYSDVASKKVARIFHGTSPDGLNFYMDSTPAIAPGPTAEDRDGCEDPTVIPQAGDLVVYYTGWDQSRLQATLMLARGTSAYELRKLGPAMCSTPRLTNPKEAEVVRAADGTWRLFFEFASDGASRIGLARAGNLEGPWQFAGIPFENRMLGWDAFHLSTGPTVLVAGDPVMFYNGANQDASWRIGWVRFDANYNRVVERCDLPLIVPPAPTDGDDRDIAFAASAIRDGDLIRVYYSVADQYMRRATVYVVGS